MKYGDIIFTKDGVLGKLDEILANLAVEIQLKTENGYITEEKFKEILEEKAYDLTKMSEWDFQNRYVEELESREKSCEYIEENIANIRAEISKLTKGLPTDTLDKFLSERAKYFSSLKGDAAIAEYAVPQRLATSHAQQIVKIQKLEQEKASEEPERV